MFIAVLHFFMCQVLRDIIILKCFMHNLVIIAWCDSRSGTDHHVLSSCVAFLFVSIITQYNTTVSSAMNAKLVSKTVGGN